MLREYDSVPEEILQELEKIILTTNPVRHRLRTMAQRFRFLHHPNRSEMLQPSS